MEFWTRLIKPSASTKKPKLADLHVHTFYSDSTFSPEEVTALAHKKGLSAIAITDHDTVDGIDETAGFAAKFSLEVIPATELTAELNGREIHILGYFVNHYDRIFLDQLKELKAVRVERIYEMVKRLKLEGVNSLSAQEIIASAGKAAVGRVHIALMMKKQGLVKNIPQAFAKYIGDDCPAYVSKFRLSPKEAIDIIRRAQGIPVLAHPLNIVSDELIPQLVEAGLLGIEVYYPKYSNSVIVHHQQLCKEYGLLATGGSDDHGLAKEEILMGKMKVAYEVVERMKQRRKELYGI
ncbi:MAG: PHP domain-containing protein [Candidatus Omnitrophota bacterium]